MEYYIIFNKYKNAVNFNIYLQEDEKIIPVFLRVTQTNVLDNIEEFNTLYDYIKEYFHGSNLKMTKNDFHLFYNTFINFQLTLPTVHSLSLTKEKIQVKYEELTPKEILFLMYTHGKGVNSKVAKYFIDEYQLDLDFTYDKLIYYGYLTTNDYLFNLKNATKAELIYVINKYKLPSKGNKSELIETILAHVNPEFLKVEFDNKCYKLTDLGNSIVNGHENLNEFHKSYYRYANGLRIEEFYLLSMKYKDLDAKDVCKIMVDEKNKMKLNNFDWNSLFDESKKDKLDNQFIEIVNKKRNDEPQENLQQAPVVKEEKLSITVNKPIIKKGILEEKEEVQLAPVVKETQTQSVSFSKPIIKFDDVINKYESKEIKQKPIYKEQDKVVGMDEFLNVINKYNTKVDVQKNQITHDEFMNIVYKRKKQVERENNEVKLSSLHKYLVNDDENKEKTKADPIIVEEKFYVVTDIKKSPFKLFFSRYLFSVILSVITIYYLYTYVFV